MKNVVSEAINYCNMSSDASDRVSDSSKLGHVGEVCRKNCRQR